jgi:hypothetical protein
MPELIQEAGNEKLHRVGISSTLEPLAEFHWDCYKCQGTTLVVPKDKQEDVGL